MAKRIDETSFIIVKESRMIKRWIIQNNNEIEAPQDVGGSKCIILICFHTPKFYSVFLSLLLSHVTNTETQIENQICRLVISFTTITTDHHHNHRSPPFTPLSTITRIIITNQINNHDDNHHQKRKTLPVNEEDDRSAHAIQEYIHWNTLDVGHSSLSSNKNSFSNGRDKESLLSGFPRMKNVIDLDETPGEGDERHPLLVDSESDITGPETPGTRPLVPRLKRVQEDGFNFGSATTHSSIDSTKRVRFSNDLSAEGKKDGVAYEISKRVTFSLDSPAKNKKPELSSDNSKRGKFSYNLPADIKKPELATDNINRSKFFHNLSAEIKKPELASDNSKRSKYFHDLPAEIKKEELASDMGSKFDWLHPSKIKDANGRRPGNPLYDKRTLYIPPDVLRKMSASQKQYWSVKSEYMDGKFYELYEVDAEIRHKELDWKMTMSGVGKCRQVGISESGIDDAVEKLLARGYKVGREQLETSEQAKSRGGTTVIQRKLVNVLTPSTLIHGNIGPQAVHLLALKEVKAFGFLVKGLRAGMHLLMLLQKEDNVFSLLSKLFTLPMLSGSYGLDKFLTQFEAAVDSDFPNYQAHELKDSDAELLSILIELFMEKANEWFQVIFALNCIDVLASFATTANFSCMAMSRPVIIPRSSSDFSQGSKGPSLHMKGLCHRYALAESGGTPVPNDLCLGDNEFGYNPRTLLLTGPNMGGKSTILRATCLVIILAQATELSPVDFEEFSLPYLKQIVDTVKQTHPTLPLMHIGSGGLLERLPLTGVDVVSLDWTVDMAEGRKRLGTDIAVQGNVDPSVLFGSKEFITNRINDTVKKAGKGKHILNLGHGIKVGTPEENVAHFF
ncbi:MUTS-like protein [Artemisia annua]|uniref:MUTS-like protein n=1 Tax=Artemisia annua TaxID=35608 RepID=A0A2U1M7L1_ARTAN|nr:MUTS-like protein [Artemisia annua]